MRKGISILSSSSLPPCRMGLDGDAGCERRRRCEGQIRRGRMLGPIGIFAIAALLRIEPSHNSAAADLPGVQRHATARVQVSGKGAARREGFHGFLSIRLDVGHEKGIPAPMFRLRLRGGGAAAEDGGGASGGSGGGDGEGWKSAFEAACQATAMAGDEEPELAAGSAPSNGQAGWGSIAGGGAGMVDGFLKGEEEELEGWSKTNGQKEKNEKKATGKREGKDGGSAVVELERGTGRGGDVDDEGDVKLDVAAAAGVGAVGRIDGERVGGARRQADKPSRGISKKLGDKPGTHIKLIGAEQLGKSRRDSFEKRELEGLKETMSFAEWRKFGSSKHRKKVRKLAAREKRREMLTQQTTTEMENLEASLPNLSGSLSIAPQQRFDPAYLGRGMVLSSGGLVVKRVPGVNVASFALFGNDQATGLSKYSVRIDGKRNSIYIGVLVAPWDPTECFAKSLQSSAWMLSDSGKVYETQQGTARNPLLERVVPMPDGGVKEELEIPLIGTQLMWSKHKWHAHKYAIKAGSLVHMIFDRPRETLSFSVDDKEWFTLEGVSRYARPFINMFAPNDGASILRAEDGPSLDIS